MAILIQTENFPETAGLMAVVNDQFSKGVETVDLVQGKQIVGTILSRDATKKALARKVAEQWLAEPDFLKDLEASLKEHTEDWD